jgi:hypothetical protein
MIESPAAPPVSREQAASEAEAVAVAQRQPVPVAAGAGLKRIRRPAPPESRRQPARGEPFFRQRHTSASSKVEGLTYTATLGKVVDEKS